MTEGVCVLGVGVQGVSVQGVSDWRVCVLGVSVRGYMSGGVLSCHPLGWYTPQQNRLMVWISVKTPNMAFSVSELLDQRLLH